MRGNPDNQNSNHPNNVPEEIESVNSPPSQTLPTPTNTTVETAANSTTVVQIDRAAAEERTKRLRNALGEGVYPPFNSQYSEFIKTRTAAEIQDLLSEEWLKASVSSYAKTL